MDGKSELINVAASNNLEKKFKNIDAEFSHISLKGKDDALKLHGKVTEWRDDVSTLASHIDNQLKYCKNLRTSNEMELITGGAVSVKLVEYHSSKNIFQYKN